jgi:MerR family transcriptional regulator, light-induced transcriptional regulator
MPQTSSTTALYTASEVEARTGVPATTLRQWERRYGFPSPSRTAGGYRMYSPFDLACIGFIQARQAEGVVVSRAVSLAREHFVPPPSFELPIIDELLRALLRPDHREAARLLGQAHESFSTEEVMLGVMQPVMSRVGELWERGEITVAHEHQASAFLRARLTQLLEAAGFNEVGPVMVVACGPGEYHELGLLVLAVLLARRGFNVHYLGSDTPLSDLAKYSRDIGAWAVLMTVNTEESLARFQADLSHLNLLGLPLYLGGHMLNAQPDLAPKLGGQYLGPSATEAADLLAQQVLRSRPDTQSLSHRAPSAQPSAQLNAQSSAQAQLKREGTDLLLGEDA